VSAGHAFRVLIGRAELEERIAELAREIGHVHAGEPPVVVAVLEGARRFAEALARQLPGQPRMHGVRASSYGDRTVSAGEVRVAAGEGSGLEVDGRVVLLVEDIVDTGRTVATLREWLLGKGARKVEVATLLSKPARRVVEVGLEYVGFEIEDVFVIGFGMDVGGRYRELEEVVVYEEDRERGVG
jgi:hypoxanthine phosphoribosyltransferase